jgi:GR25 family glycosyltransferase involved in LPS biosynthesis
MTIYLINLDRHPERLAHMREQLDGVPFERISGVDGSTRPATTKGLTRFELACLESHRTAWRRFLASGESLACFLEDDVHVQPGFAALLSDGKWVPKDAHTVKLDTYFQKVRLGGRVSASGGREIARLYTRHESAAAYILSRDGAQSYLELTESARQPADYAVFPNNPRRLGLNIYQLVPAIAIQDHLIKEGKRFATAMTKTDARAVAARSSVVRKLGRESARFAGQVSNLGERAYQKAFLRVETTTVPLK